MLLNDNEGSAILAFKAEVIPTAWSAGVHVWMSHRGGANMFLLRGRDSSCLCSTYTTAAQPHLSVEKYLLDGHVTRRFMLDNKQGHKTLFGV